MNKTSTRLATLGAIVVLGAFAIVLAQNDARKRDRSEPAIEPMALETAVPIPMDEMDSDWGTPGTPDKLVVRGNNDQLTSYRPAAPIANENPLREDVDRELSYEDSRVIPAAAGLPIEPPASSGRPTTATPANATPSHVSSPPSWLGGSLPAPNAAAAPAPAVSPTAAQPAGPNNLLPALPTFPMNGLGSAAEGSPPALLSTMPSAPPTMSSPSMSNSERSMSDTQRPAMQPTNVMPAPSQLGAPYGQDVLAAQQANPAYGAPRPTLGQVAPIAAETPPVISSPAMTGTSTFPANTYPTPQSSVATTSAPAQPAWPSASSNTGNSTASRTPAALTALVSNQPGNRYLDGSQNPSLIIQKRAPEEIQVGKKATFVISVRNAGNATAHDVRVVDSVPQGVRFSGSAPEAAPTTDGILTWNLGEMAAGDERTITVELIPEVQGEVGSNALVYFAAQASVRTVATLPKLEFELKSQSEMLIGSRQQVQVIVKNSGTGVARGARLEVDLPELLKHDLGQSLLSANLGDISPNAVQPITLDLAAVHPGQASVVFRAVSDDGVLAEKVLPIDVLAPQLTASIDGPKLRYLDRQATYQIVIKNIGTTAATNLDFVVHLPSGLRYISANNSGNYDTTRHTVTWGLHELPAGQPAPIELTVLPVELGPQAISLIAVGDLQLRAEAKAQVMVDGLADLAYTVGQDNGTIEVGATSTYSVQITNMGNKSDKDVRLAVQLPSGAKLVDVKAQVPHRAEGNQILFDPIPEMRNKDQYTYRFQVQHTQPGTQIVRTQLTSANWPVAVIKEEGTLVYNDQN